MKKQWYKTWWVWALIIAAVIIIAAQGGGNDKPAARATLVPQLMRGEEIEPAGARLAEHEPKPARPEQTESPSPAPTMAPVPFETERDSGNYTSGIDFPAGKYDITAVFGGGNVSSSNAFSGGINAIMGVTDDDWRI